MGFMKQVVLSEELAYRRAPNTAYIGITYAGPTVIVYGNEEQKKEFLPGITSGEIVWCQGYSEPNAGSDLAGLETRAVKDGDDYVINGTKIWSSNAHMANWCFLLARTDTDAPKHKGITYLMTPMDAPGITVRPLVNMANEHVFNEIIFEDVRIPAKYRVGEENRGWYIGMTTLDFERSNISSAAQSQRSIEQIVEYVRETSNGKTENGIGASRDKARVKLADLAIANEAGRMPLVPRRDRCRSAARSRTTSPAPRRSTTPRSGSGSRAPASASWACTATLREESKHARMRGRFARTYMTSVGSTIAAGTSEIQRGIIAQRGLGLSRI